MSPVTSYQSVDRRREDSGDLCYSAAGGESPGSCGAPCLTAGDSATCCQHNSYEEKDRDYRRLKYKSCGSVKKKYLSECVIFLFSFRKPLLEEIVKLPLKSHLHVHSKSI